MKTVTEASNPTIQQNKEMELKATSNLIAVKCKQPNTDLSLKIRKDTYNLSLAGSLCISSFTDCPLHN